MYVTGDNPPSAIERGDLLIVETAQIVHHESSDESGAWSGRGRGRLRRIQSIIWHTELSERRLKHCASSTPRSEGRDVTLHFWRDGQK